MGLQNSLHEMWTNIMHKCR